MSGNLVNKTFLLLILLGFSQSAIAVELFGVQLASSTIDQLRTAVKQAGASVIQESGDGRPYDIFDSTSVIPGSSKLYIGHVAETRQVAFVEYEFPGLKQDDMLKMLSNKYGDPTVGKARFISDKSYFWEVSGVGVSFRVDWQNYRVLISYIVPEAISNIQIIANGKIIDNSFY